jgi:hypothetical protein
MCPKKLPINIIESSWQFCMSFAWANCKQLFLFFWAQMARNFIAEIHLQRIEAVAPETGTQMKPLQLELKMQSSATANLTEKPTTCAESIKSFPNSFESNHLRIRKCHQK